MNKHFAFYGLSLLIVSACAWTGDKPAKISESHSEAEAAALAAEGKIFEGADKYARIGELLLMAQGVQHADEMFAKALQLDANNVRATFYSAFTKLALVNHGIATRVEPLLDSGANADLQRFRDNLEKRAVPEITALFLTVPNGKSVFRNYRDMQLFLKDEVQPELINSSSKIAALMSRNEKFGVSVDLVRLGLRSARAEEIEENISCTKKSGKGWTCEGVTESKIGFSFSTPNRYVVDKSDLKVIHGAMLGAIVQIQLATAYNATGAEVARQRIRGLSEARARQGLDITDREVVRFIQQHPQLGVLEAGNELHLIASNMNEALQHVLDLNSIVDDLCPQEGARSQNILNPICITMNMADKAQLTLDVLAGPTVLELARIRHHTGLWQPLQILADVTKVIRNPPADLKSYLPNQFDSTGKISTYVDPTFGGLFPNGDFIKKVKYLGGVKHVKARRAR